MQDDERCCGTGTCIIDTQGRCWCGQQWDGTQMCYPATDQAARGANAYPPAQESDAADPRGKAP